MTARTHDAFAFAALVTVASYFPPEAISIYTFFGCIVGNVVGGAIPDLDQAGNKLWDLLPAGHLLGRVFRRVFYKHRTLTHSLIGLFVIWKGLFWLTHAFINSNFANPNLIFASIMIGYISHLLADSFTEEGIPIFFPFKFRFGIPPITKWRIVTGGWFEKYVILPGIAVYLVWFIKLHADNIVRIFTSMRY